MKFIVHSFRHAVIIMKEKPYSDGWKSFCKAIDGITDEEIIHSFENRKKKDTKSISDALNKIIKKHLVAEGWASQSRIFGDDRFKDKHWTLDFAKEGDADGKGGFSVEIAFNHGEATAWNLMKPVLASELNHAAKAIQTEIGIVAMAA
jgi:hypothetical protein